MKKQDSPLPHTPPKYGTKHNMLNMIYLPLLEKKSRSIDDTLLMTLSALTAQQTEPTQETMEKVQQFLDYSASQKPAMHTTKVGWL